jgi:D-glycero-alpha-D-manno-heptose-7-phosphate kinase
MIISRTPFRISFFGGGTDYPAWYREHGGAVLATTIDKYCYVTCRWRPPFFEDKHRVVYSQTETVQEIDEIRHPSVRETLRFMKITAGIEIHHDADLPARTGIGSSSAFTVGLLHALYALKGLMPSKMQLATQAIHIEQNMIKENVGCQDQILAAFGGFNQIRFNGGINVTPITVNPELLQSHLMLFFTGFSRTASQLAGRLIQDMPKRKKELIKMQEMVDEGVKTLNMSDITDFGRLLHESWQLKRSLTTGISTDYIDYLYDRALKAGAVGGKLCGAGGGGFLLLFVPKEAQDAVRQELKLLEVPFKFENLGSRIIFCQQPG